MGCSPQGRRMVGPDVVTRQRETHAETLSQEMALVPYHLHSAVEFSDVFWSGVSKSLASVTAMKVRARASRSAVTVAGRPRPHVALSRSDPSCRRPLHPVLAPVRAGTCRSSLRAAAGCQVVLLQGVLASSSRSPAWLPRLCLGLREAPTWRGGRLPWSPVTVPFALVPYSVLPGLC